jgi:hypothetical protein
MGDVGLVYLTERFVRLSGELNDTRDAMKRLLLNGAGESPIRPTHPARLSGGGSSIRMRSRRKKWRRTSSSQGGAEAADRDCGGDGGQAVDDLGAHAAHVPAESGRAGRRRGLGGVRLTPEEVADLLTPATSSRAPWVKPLSALARGEETIARFG